MKRHLFSELRTIYETTAFDPHTFRIAIRLKDVVDGAMLRRAVEQTMERYPYFRVRVSVEGGKVVFAENPAPVPVIQTDQRIVLGGGQTSGHLIAFCCWDNWLYIDAYHGLTDGGGIAPLIRTLLYYYCGAFFGDALSTDGVRLGDSAVSDEEWDDPAAHRISAEHSLSAVKWDKPAYQIGASGIAQITSDCIVHNIRIPEAEFMQFNLSNDGSPATIVALLLARSIDALRGQEDNPAVIAMCVNQRRALRAPLAHQSLVGDVRLPYTDRLRALPFSTQATCFRGMVALQSDEDMVLEEIRQYQTLIAHLETLDGHPARRACCVSRMKALSGCITATVSYVGKANLGDLERYIQEYAALPSTALPSTHVPLTIEMSAVNGYFFLNFIQYFREPAFFRAFIRQLRDKHIDYDILNSAEALYPGVELPV